MVVLYSTAQQRQRRPSPCGSNWQTRTANSVIELIQSCSIQPPLGNQCRNQAELSVLKEKSKRGQELNKKKKKGATYAAVLVTIGSLPSLLLPEKDDHHRETVSLPRSQHQWCSGAGGLFKDLFALTGFVDTEHEATQTNRCHSNEHRVRVPANTQSNKKRKEKKDEIYSSETHRIVCDPVHDDSLTIMAEKTPINTFHVFISASQ